MARGLFITGFTVAEVLAIQRRAKELLLELVRKSRHLHKNSGFVRKLVANIAIHATGDGKHQA